LDLFSDTCFLRIKFPPLSGSAPDGQFLSLLAFRFLASFLSSEARLEFPTFLSLLQVPVVNCLLTARDPGATCSFIPCPPSFVGLLVDLRAWF